MKYSNIPVECAEMTAEEEKQGSDGVFAEKYGEE